MGKSNIKKIRIWLICAICLLFVVLLSLSITMAYFGLNRKFSGTLEFAQGIKIDYSNVKDNGDKSFTLQKLGDKETFSSFSGTLTDLNEENPVRSAEIFYVANPKFQPDEKTVDYYLRIKLEIKTNSVDNTTIQERPLTNDEIMNVFGNENPLEINEATESSIGFVKKGDYYYLANSGVTAISSYEDLYINNKDEIITTYLFKSDGIKQNINYFELRLAEVVPEFLVDNFILKITVEAIDARVEAGIASSDIWQLA